VSDIPPSGFAPSSTVIFSVNLPYALRSQIEHVLAETDRVHHIPKRTQASVIRGNARREQGSYDPRTACIAISRYAEDPVGTFLHEYAHFLDNRVLHPLPREYASRYDSDFDPFLEACHRSRAIFELLRILKKHRRWLTHAQIVYLIDAQEPHELFARAYAQWVCSKSFSFLLQSSLKRRLDAGMPFVRELVRIQWDPEDFADIMNALETLFERKGLL
jgi:hypothetical protein